MKYLDGHGRVIAESDSPIKFNLELFPIFKDLKIVDNKKKKEKILDSESKEESKL